MLKSYIHKHVRGITARFLCAFHLKNGINETRMRKNIGESKLQEAKETKMRDGSLWLEL